LANADEDAAIAGAKGIDMPRPRQIVGAGIIGDGGMDGGGAVPGRDAGGTPKRGAASTVTVKAVPKVAVLMGNLIVQAELSQCSPPVRKGRRRRGPA